MMMSESAVEIARCEACSAEVRDGSLFCYNCGGAVKKPSTVAETVGEPTKPPATETRATTPPMRSAASLRTRRRAINREPVKVSWERREGSPNVFIVTTIFLVLAATVLLVLALYLR